MLENEYEVVDLGLKMSGFSEGKVKKEVTPSLCFLKAQKAMKILNFYANT